MIKLRNVIFTASVAAVMVSPFMPIKEANAARSWTCNATIEMKDSTFKYTVPDWTMSGSITTDREKKCKEAVKANWLDNGKIWTVMAIPANQQNSYCQSGGNFRTDYGFNERRKTWNFPYSGKPSCACTGGMVFAQ